ncbi:MAG: hypothetical protein DRN15_04265 [Thermoprotei archaeon]|nr:MAG: hypothetical protein DRM97_06240 [Thermoprotei archaeon]RLF24116.1 MAG: hypothetical protein DRN15_04265 [Thermoprotei archaeon]
MLLVVMILLTLAQPALTQWTIKSLTIELYPDGAAMVSYLIEVYDGVGMLNITLLGVPEFLIVSDDEGNPLHYELYDDMISILLMGSRYVNVTYYTMSLTFKEGEVWKLSVSEVPTEHIVVLPEGAKVVGLTEIPLSIEIVDGRTRLIMPKGTYEIEYVVPITPPIKPPEEKPPETPPKEAPPPSQERPALDMWLLILAIVVAIVVILTIIAIERRRRLSSEISEEEREILNALKRLGGEAYQYEVARMVNLPKTTLWRHVRRLADKGLIEIEKRGRQNYLKLR